MNIPIPKDLVDKLVATSLMIDLAIHMKDPEKIAESVSRQQEVTLAIAATACRVLRTQQESDDALLN